MKWTKFTIHISRAAAIHWPAKRRRLGWPLMTNIEPARCCSTDNKHLAHGSTLRPSWWLVSV